MNNILCPFHYVPLRGSPAGRNYGRTFGDMNITNDYATRLVRLPIHSNLQDDAVFSYVIEKVYEFFRH